MVMPDKRWKDWVVKAGASAGFVGYCPVASGTAGTLVGLLLFLLIQGSLWLHGAVLTLVFFAGVALSTRAERLYKEKDSHRIVIDEVAGFLVTMLGFSHVSWPVLAVAFVLNRVFDIFKPFGLRRLEKAPAGWGVMLDDVGAGIYSNLLLRGILAIF